MTTKPLQFSNLRWGLLLGVAVGLTAALAGALLGFAGPLIAAGAFVALAAGLWALTNLEIGLWGAVAIAALLPFAALPVKVVFTPTFLDLALGSVLAVYALQWMTGQRRRLTLTPAHGPLAAFVVLAVFSFAAGMPNGPLTSNLLRQFAELLLNILLAFIVVDYVDSAAKLERLARVIALGGAAAALIGIGLYVLPPDTADAWLSRLAVLGYPAGGVLRYIEDDPANAQRAIATSVDPNVLGGLLAIVGGLLAPQLFARRPLLRWRWLDFGAVGLVLVCLALTYSRGAMVALAVAVIVVAAVRYRPLLLVLAAVAVLFGLLPATQAYVLRFAAAAQGQDLATQMRFGEYKDAFILIQRYPLFGVGFAGTPEIDIYLGVSSAYLLLAEQMGLPGLGVFLLVMAIVFGWAAGRLRGLAAADDGLVARWLGFHAGLLAALVVGVVDHYFFQLSFQPAGTLFWMFVGFCLAGTRLLRGAFSGGASSGV